MIKFALKPRVSEKAYNLSQNSNVYVFEVPVDSNKVTIAETVKAQYEVTVINVRTVTVKGKSMRAYRKRQGWVSGQKSDFKKAYVTLKEGDQIAIFPAEEEVKDENTKQPSKSKKSTRSIK